MSFQESIRVCMTTKYADFSGRATRSEYWWFVLFVVLVSLAASAIHSVLATLVSLGTLLPLLAAAARRLHDTHRSGWWQLICLVPVIGLIVIVVFLAQDTKADDTGVLA